MKIVSILYLSTKETTLDNACSSELGFVLIRELTAETELRDEKQLCAIFKYN